VYLLSFPVHSRIEDIHIQTLLDEHYIDADLRVKVEVFGPGMIELRLFDSNCTLVANTSEDASGNGERTIYQLSLQVKNPLKWTAETPNLYHLVVSYGSQFLAQRVGFRQVELKDGLIKVNGSRVVFRGVNRHEHHPLGGRNVPFEFLRRDLVIMKTHNINAIRTSHQPNDPRLYDLADEMGVSIAF
jgi:beta-galactosidase